MRSAAAMCETKSVICNLVPNNIFYHNEASLFFSGVASFPEIACSFQMNSEDTANLVSFLEKQKSRYQMASKEITELKKKLTEIQNSDTGSASDAVQQLRNEVATLRSRVSMHYT